MRMKSVLVLSALLSISMILSACTVTIDTKESAILPQDDSASVMTDQIVENNRNDGEESSAHNETTSNETAQSIQNGNASSNEISLETDDLQFYEKLSDIPNAKLEFAYNKARIVINGGEAIVDAPPQHVFVDSAYSDGEWLYIKEYLPDESFRWMAINYTGAPIHERYVDDYFLPSISDSREITSAAGSMLWFNDTEGFDTETRQWIKDGEVLPEETIY